MRFPHAQAGVSKLYISQLLSLIAALCTVVSGITLIIFAGSAISNLANGADATGSLAGAGISGIFVIISAILTIIALIFMIIGLTQAQKDDNSIRVAFFCVIGSLVLTIVSAFLGSSPVLAAILQLVASIANFLVIFFVIKGIQNIAEKLGDTALIEKAKRLFMIILITYIASFVIAFVANLLKSGPALTIAGILGIIAAIVQIISTFLYLGLLKHARESFKA